MSAAWDLAAAARMAELEHERDRLLVQVNLAKAARDELADLLEEARAERDLLSEKVFELAAIVERYKLAVQTPDCDRGPNE